MNIKMMIAGTAFLGIALTSCGRKPEAQTSPSSKELVASATPELHLVAPAGVYFLIEKATVETDSGVLNFRPGAKLHRVGGRYITSDGHQLTLRDQQVTNNLQLAQKAAGNDPKALAIIQATVQTARVLQPSPAATATNASGPASGNQATYGRPATLKASEAEERKFDNSRKSKK